MTDAAKGITVTTYDQRDEKADTAAHPNATGVEVMDHHLLVLQGGKTLAVYAPGWWASAVVNEATSSTTASPPQ
ncbi:hypothetical protein [Micromonospora thermarum]|uniref:Uncharacterized protein n=1 Tax=Micromonospora thermarum TaxID=2720024 RepID=A0ABX0ZCJ4_9ACTN|nr:hypothetical protein [Micromonospora thermarum]NJP33698.1 hypothetical protein [Micromonospora thermarum]